MEKAIKIYTAILLVLCSSIAHAQIRINEPGRVVERQAENRANRKIDQAVDKGFDKVEEGIGNLFKKKDKKTKETNTEPGSKQAETNTDNSSTEQTAESNTPVPAGKASLKSYSKFDFIPGEKIVAVEDFAQDAVGDFPAKWNTNSSGEIVTIEGTEGKWLMLGPEGVF